MKHFCLLVLFIGAATAASDTDGLITGALKFVKDCNDKSITLCIKVRRIGNLMPNFECEKIRGEVKSANKKFNFKENLMLNFGS
jgi:hypothetical protein